MLFEVLGTIAGYKTRKYRKIITVLILAFIVPLLASLILQFADNEILDLISFVFIPIPVNLLLDQLLNVQYIPGIDPALLMRNPFAVSLFIGIYSVMMAFLYYLVGKFAKWLLSKRDLLKW
jgi:hypothetical protein